MLCAWPHSVTELVLRLYSRQCCDFPSGITTFSPSRRTSLVQIGLTRHIWSQMTSLDKSGIIQVVGRCRRRCCQTSVISQSSPDAAQSAGAADQVLISLFLKHSFGSICFGPSSTSQKTKKDDSFHLGIIMTPDLGLTVKCREVTLCPAILNKPKYNLMWCHFLSILLFPVFYLFLWMTENSFTKLTLNFQCSVHLCCSISITCHRLYMREVTVAGDDTRAHVSMPNTRCRVCDSVISRHHQRFKQSAAAGLNVLSKMKMRCRREEWNYGARERSKRHDEWSFCGQTFCFAHTDD